MARLTVHSWWARARDQVRSWWMGPINAGDRELAKFFQYPGTLDASSGVVVNEITAMGVSAFACAVHTISWDIAGLPLFLYERLASGGKARYDAHPLNFLLHDQANPETTAFVFRQALLISALSTGNGYAEIERDGGGRPVALWNVHADRVMTLRENGVLWYRVSQLNGGSVMIPAADMLHVKGPSACETFGVDMVSLAREALGLSIAAERYGAAVFSNGNQMGGVISTTANLTDTARENIRKALAARHQGAHNAFKLLLLENGSTFSATTANARDAQLNELRLYQVREIARFFRIPVSLLGDLERSTFTNSEQQQIAYYTQCLRPWLENIEQEFGAKLLFPTERRKALVEFVVEGLLAADTEKRGAFYSQMLDHGVFSINEVREKENLPPIDGGDRPRVPMNFEQLPTSKAQPPAVVNPRDAMLLTAQRDVLIEAFDAVIKREAERARQAQTTPDKFRKWAIGFYEGHGEWMRVRIVPALRAWAACIGGDLTTFDGMLDTLIADWVARSKRDFAPVLTTTDPDAMSVALERVLRRWESERAIRMTDELLAHGTAALGLPPAPPAAERHPLSVMLARKHQLLVEAGWPSSKPPKTNNVQRIQEWLNTAN